MCDLGPLRQLCPVSSLNCGVLCCCNVGLGSLGSLLLARSWRVGFSCIVVFQWSQFCAFMVQVLSFFVVFDVAGAPFYSFNCKLRYSVGT